MAPNRYSLTHFCVGIMRALWVRRPAIFCVLLKSNVIGQSDVFCWIVSKLRLGERTGLSFTRFRRACPGLERTSESYAVFPFNILFSRESPGAIPAKIRASGAMILVACHLYPQPGTSPTEDFAIKTQSLVNVMPYALHISNAT